MCVGCKKDVIKVAKLHAEKMITGCQATEKLCKISLTARKLHSMKLSCQHLADHYYNLDKLTKSQLFFFCPNFHIRQIESQIAF